MKRLSWFLSLLLLGAPGAAFACSLAPGYRAPSNLELAGAADTIVLAKVMSGRLDADNPEASTVTIHPLEAIKGLLPGDDIPLKGMMLTRDAGAEYAVLSNPYEFGEAHPVSYIGACIRYLFPLGTTALFFLDRQDGEWVPAGGAFSRWAEDVPGADAPWVQLVRFYARIAELPAADRTELMEDEREALLARLDEPVAQLMAADITRQLGQSAAIEDPFERPGGAVESVLDAMRREGSGD